MLWAELGGGCGGGRKGWVEKVVDLPFSLLLDSARASSLFLRAASSPFRLLSLSLLLLPGRPLLREPLPDPLPLPALELLWFRLQPPEVCPTRPQL